jgi:hypothetical protein
MVLMEIEGHRKKWKLTNNDFSSIVVHRQEQTSDSEAEKAGDT